MKKNRELHSATQDLEFGAAGKKKSPDEVKRLLKTLEADRDQVIAALTRLEDEAHKVQGKRIGKEMAKRAQAKLAQAAKRK